MQDEALVEMADRQRDLLDERGGPRLVAGEALELRLQVAGHQLHREIQLSGVLPGLVDRHDVRVVEPREHPDLLLKQTQRERGGILPAVEHLEGHVAAHLRVVCLVDHPHRAAAQALPQLVTTEHHARPGRVPMNPEDGTR